jgi:3-methyladenine DNA glycosylase/8-oxoguanine DNA glycosylase
MPQVTPLALVAIDDQKLHAAGMSHRKIEYAKGLARAITDNSFAICSCSTITAVHPSKWC